MVIIIIHDGGGGGGGGRAASSARTLDGTVITSAAAYLPARSIACSYHYLPSLMFGELLTARLIEAIVGRRHIATAAKVTFLVLGATWLFFSPWWYAYPLTSEGHARRRWLPRWD